MEAVKILGQREEYVYTNEEHIPQPLSLAHTYTWFKGNQVDYEFCLVLCTHARISVDKSAVCRSPNGIPYAPLKELVQSYLDINDQVSLCDIVDGANLSYSWGLTYLDLNGTTDVEWAQQRNAEMMGGVGKFNPSEIVSLFPTARVERESLWRKTTEEKEQRLAQMMLPYELFETRFMLKGSPSKPWREFCDAC